MKPKMISKKKSVQNIRSGKLKVVKAFKSGGVIQVTVKLQEKSKSVQNFVGKIYETSYPRTSVHSMSVSSVSTKAINTTRQSPSKTSPGDFIEPIEDLSIPSTFDYIFHTKHQPTKSMNDVVSTPTTHMKPPRPNTLIQVSKFPIKTVTKYRTVGPRKLNK